MTSVHACALACLCSFVCVLACACVYLRLFVRLCVLMNHFLMCVHMLRACQSIIMGAYASDNVNAAIYDKHVKS